MRCLYCGKELPLFKRLRGGEFCSDAHRQQYQEEYTQLALNRLLQAHGTGETEPAGQGKPGKETPTAPIKDAKPAPPPRPQIQVESPALMRREKQAREETAPTPGLALGPAAKATLTEPPAPTPARLAAPLEMRPPTAVLEPEPPPPEPVNVVEDSPVRVPLPPLPEPEPEPVDEEPAPAEMANYLAEVPIAVMAETALARPEPDSESSSAPVLPRMTRFRYTEDATRLAEAGQVPVARLTHAADSPASPRERGMEVRDFVRSQPMVEIRLAPAGEIGLAYSTEPLEVHFGYRLPLDSARLWQPVDCEFPAREVTWDEMARPDFETTGWSEAALAEVGEDHEPVGEKAIQLKPAASVDLAPPAAPQQVRFDPIRFEPIQTRREPVHFEPVHIEPVFLERSAAPVQLPVQAAVQLDSRAAEQPASASALEPPPEPPSPAPPPEPSLTELPSTELPSTELPQTPPAPEAITKPLPVTLHGLAPVRGKSVQVFSSALARTSEALAPMQNALPLRPVMVLAPAPALEATAKAPSPIPVRTTVPEKQEGRPAGKGRKPEARILSLHLGDDAGKSEAPKEKEAPSTGLNLEPKPEPQKTTPVEKAESSKVQQAKLQQAKPQPAKPQPVPVPATASAAPPASKQDKPPVEGKAARRKQVATPFTPPEFDTLGLPKLGVEADGNFWTRLPILARVGVAAGFLAMIAGGIFLTQKGSSAPHAEVPGTPVYDVGPQIATDAGWATDWFTDGSGSRQTRHVDVLRDSLTLRDYRIEFEGQIERQAMGWVFRANNKSFYVEKLAIGAGFEPPVDLVRFAVIDGKEQPRHKIRLPFTVHLDTMYRVRTDVKGHEFTTWIQDQQVDQWTDNRIDGGGVGLYYDSGDVPRLKGSVNVLPLRQR